MRTRRPNSRKLLNCGNVLERGMFDTMLTQAKTNEVICFRPLLSVCMARGLCVVCVVCVACRSRGLCVPTGEGPGNRRDSSCGHVGL